jgi:hypothetical protein
VALAVNGVTRQLNKVMVNGSAGTARLTGDLCSPNTVHWTFDNFALANGTGRAVVSTGGDTWFFITADYAFGHDLEAQTTAVVNAMGGKVLGSTKAQSELIPLVEQNSITKNSCNEQFYLFDFSGESNVSRFANPEGKRKWRAYSLLNVHE